MTKHGKYKNQNQFKILTSYNTIHDLPDSLRFKKYSMEKRSLVEPHFWMNYPFNTLNAK